MPVVVPLTNVALATILAFSLDLQLVQAVNKVRAHRVRVEVSHVEDLDTRLLEHVAVERDRGISQVRKLPDSWGIVKSALLTGVQVEFKGADRLMLRLNAKLGVRVVELFWVRDILLESGAPSEVDLAMVGILCANSLDVIDSLMRGISSHLDDLAGDVDAVSESLSSFASVLVKTARTRKEHRARRYLLYLALTLAYWLNSPTIEPSILFVS
ncbi:uncharacterized protein K460DRAFT_434375 [Cucurbitaria berberidis CBS 394.84]|uniref:Uncharacterized protein n=1 Tax=Cucurbitaria berberidis CBS 394.84 TaxID=1168544 RepID=A0A9P4GFY9_9PLEO|nr:uncharacterized protein K460DRAFT_434375 [Cucurbitaria berberidis CBS 394.84]KAF1844465.1 hypothetical protein K460DRAFT_434375 [Cucurbitaria berberidis CBS 394.84]